MGEKAGSFRNTRQLVGLLEANMSTLNYDIHLTRPTPKGGGVDGFVAGLEADYFRDLAGAFKTVRRGEVSFFGDTQIPKPLSLLRVVTRRAYAERQKPAYRLAHNVLTDLYSAASQNAALLDKNIPVRMGSYRGSKTRFGEVMLTFYDLLMGSAKEAQVPYMASQRSTTLARDGRFALSPLMNATKKEDNTALPLAS